MINILQTTESPKDNITNTQSVIDHSQPQTI